MKPVTRIVHFCYWIGSLFRRDLSSAVIDYCFAVGKIVFQSSFILITIQPFFFASSMSVSLNVPIFESTP